jgi:hypothetical protein
MLLSRESHLGVLLSGRLFGRQPSYRKPFAAEDAWMSIPSFQQTAFGGHRIQALGSAISEKQSQSCYLNTGKEDCHDPQ